MIAKLLGRHGIDHDYEELMQKLPLLGTDIDRCDEAILDIEIFPNRPDLLSGETLTRAIRNFIHLQPASPSLSVSRGEIELKVDNELVNIRPIILGAVVRGVNQGNTQDERDLFIKSLMDHQEKLHFALGRGRKRASIGVHDLSKIQPPFTVRAVDKDTKFIPLARDAEMTIEQILNEHPKGIDYAHLLDGFSKYPVICDADDKILSFPPIINGNHTTVTQDTTDFFIDVTGWDYRSCEASLMLIAIQLMERGGSIESVNITDCNGEQHILPNGKAIIHDLDNKMLSDLLGRELTESEISEAINKMGGNLFSYSYETSKIAMPRWRLTFFTRLI